MTDVHVHIERGPYTLGWIRKFAEHAAGAGVEELWLLEHSHRFREFAPLYAPVAAHDDFQRDWLQSRMDSSFGDYLALVRFCRQRDFPVRLRWGLEVCWFPEGEALIRAAMKKADCLDFLTGAVHHVDGWGFDHRSESWDGKDVDSLYSGYYESMIALVESGLFGTLAHPDSIKCFGNLPGRDMGPWYDRLSRALAAKGTAAEVSAGLMNNYGHDAPGMNVRLLESMKRNGVRLVTASDAHQPEDVGKNLDICAAQIAQTRTA